MRSLKTLLAVILALALGAPATRAADEAHTLTLRLDWLPSGYQTPFFLAQEKGWFAKAGLQVSIDQGNGSATTVQLVGTGQYDVGFAALSNMAFGHSKGIPVVSIAGFFRKGDLALLVPVDSPIKTPADVKGKKLITTPGSLESPFLDAFFAKGGLDRSQVDLLSVDASAKIPTYMAGGNDGAFTSTAYTLPLVAAKRPARPVLFADFDLNLPGFGLFTTAAVLQKKGDALKSLASITAGAWAYILNGHQEEAVQAMMKAREQDRLDAGVLAGQLTASLPYLYTEASAKLPIGVQSAADWAGAIALMEKAKVIEPGSKPADYFTNDYLDLTVIKSLAAGG